MTSIDGLVDDVENHQEGFRGMATILQVHERHITVSGTISQDMVQYINALIEENEKQAAWIGSLMKQSQAQTEVLRQHEMGQTPSPK